MSGFFCRRAVALGGDETAQAYVDYLIVVFFIVIALIGASQLFSRVLVKYLKRIFYVVSLPLP